MILIADSGSTKTNWALTVGEKIIREVRTEGINPFFRSIEDISEELSAKLIPDINHPVAGVYFYGAGIISSGKGAGIRMLLQDFFPGAKVETYSDLLAAARATCGREAGIACILGTGSNSCLYNGEKITAHVSPLGFILGDEGSGAVMGRKLLGDYLKHTMPEKLRAHFNSDYNVNRADVLERVYKKERPNLFLASFSGFLYKNIDTAYCRNFVRNEFDSFIERNLKNYPDFRKHKINFTGSVAFYFKEILKEALEKQSLTVGKIVRDPMEGLVRFHSTEK